MDLLVLKTIIYQLFPVALDLGPQLGSGFEKYFFYFFLEAPNYFYKSLSSRSAFPALKSKFKFSLINYFQNILYPAVVLFKF